MATTAHAHATPADLPGHVWWAALKRTVKAVPENGIMDWAASLTYYAVLSVFPGLIVLTAIVGLLGPDATRMLTDSINSVQIGQGRDLLVGAIENAHTAAGPLAIIGLLGALWAATGYLGGFMRANNALYGVTEDRPLWKTIPLQIGLTVAMMLMLAASALGLAVSGPIADQVGQWVGIGTTGLLIWGIAKWPVIIILVSLAICLLYWAAPNVHEPKPRFLWITAGSVLAVVLWLVASLGFGIYVANFASYNKTYGSLAGIIVFLVWLWISNLAVLLGASFDAELARGRREAAQ
ncbi:YihY/virulence factor BrkB family protein [Kutzneria buriramensis]|uniref:Membrane protein n=1 Tax=Kutzneria buriramensis TaxID=1045776 RepID=A0A3E0H884_9PSEU|nr:YihY/virulence factor BrkB family protein [Kutzneria buriramensis]REH39344.1 membrane protein [Kutzneria buriramensis]